jgi:hypothetical protein
MKYVRHALWELIRFDKIRQIGKILFAKFVLKMRLAAMVQSASTLGIGDRIIFLQHHSRASLIMHVQVVKFRITRSIAIHGLTQMNNARRATGALAVAHVLMVGIEVGAG